MGKRPTNKWACIMRYPPFVDFAACWHRSYRQGHQDLFLPTSEWAPEPTSAPSLWQRGQEFACVIVNLPLEMPTKCQWTAEAVWLGVEQQRIYVGRICVLQFSPAEGGEKKEREEERQSDSSSLSLDAFVSLCWMWQWHISGYASVSCFANCLILPPVFTIKQATIRTYVSFGSICGEKR